MSANPTALPYVPVRTLITVDVEGNLGGYDGGPDLPAGTPEPLRELAQARLMPDAANCDRCSNAVGPVLVDDDDDSRLRCQWRWVTLVLDVPSGKTWMLCEDCTDPFAPPGGYR